MNNHVSRFAGLSLAALSVALAAPAIAQDNSTPAPRTNNGEVAPAQEAIPGDQSTQAQSGNAIVVTGLRRSETLQDTPAAITAFGSQEIVNAGISKPAAKKTVKAA